MEIPNEERVLARYRELVSAQGCLENHILAKSSLYQRLLKGLQPLAIRPPLNHSYPWYSVVESDTPVPCLSDQLIGHLSGIHAMALRSVRMFGTGFLVVMTLISP